MKRKLNVNRERISSEEIASQKKFSTLIKSYTTLVSPFRKTSWRIKGVLWVIMASVGLVWYVTDENEFDGYEPNRIFTAQGSSVDLRGNEQLRMDIKERIANASRISSPIKGIRIEVEMTRSSDTIRIVSFGGGKWFLYNGHYYEASEALLPDSLIKRQIP